MRRRAFLGRGAVVVGVAAAGWCDADDLRRQYRIRLDDLPEGQREVAPIVTPPGRESYYLIRHDGADLVVAWHEVPGGRRTRLRAGGARWNGSPL